MVESSSIAVEVVFALPERCWRWTLQLPAGSTLADALTVASLAEAGLDIGSLPATVGVFGRELPQDTPLHAGDRVEIYRPLTHDPRAQRRERVEQERAGRKIWRPTRPG